MSSLAHPLRQAFFLVALLAAPALLAALLAGVVTSILASATRLGDRSLSVVPRVLAVVIALAISGPYLGARITAFARAMLAAVPAAGRS